MGKTNKAIKIGLTGKLRSGKDQVANYMEEYLMDRDMPVHTLGFAGGIKELLLEYVPSTFETGKPRQAYQDVGQLLRGFDADVWVNRATKTIDALVDDTSVIVKDVRQPNEVQALKDRGFTIIKVDCPTEIRVARALKKDTFELEQLYHETELAIDEIVPDHVILNIDTLDDLKFYTYELLETIYRDQLNNKKHKENVNDF